MLEPWVWLKKGFASSKLSLSIRYGSRPPLVVLISSINRRHYLLAIVSAVAVSTSVLSIAMSGLFSQSFTMIESSIALNSIYAESQLPSYWDLNSLALNTAFDLMRTNITENTPMPAWTTDLFSFIPIVIPDLKTKSTVSFTATTMGIGTYLECDEYSIPADPSGPVEIHWHYSPPQASDQANLSCASEGLPDWTPYETFSLSIMFQAPINVSSGANDHGLCADTTVLIVERWGNVTANLLAHNNMNRSALTCQPRIVSRAFDITFNLQGQIQSYKTHHSTSNTVQSIFQNSINFLAFYHFAFGNAARQSMITGDLYTAFDWPGLLTARLHWLQSPQTSLEELPVLLNYSNQTYSHIFSLWFSAYRDEILEKISPTPVQGTATFRQAQMVPSHALFIVTFTLLSLYIIVAIMILMFRRHRYAGPRMPKSLGSLIPWIAHSRFLKDFKGTQNLPSDQHDAYLDRLGKKYGFGWFIGIDGRLRLGLEEEPLLERSL